MDQLDHGSLLSASHLAEIEAVAALENRSPRDVLQEAVERFLQDRRAPDTQLLTARAVADRMLATRHLHPLPEGETIRSLRIYGRR